jgi:hypothetical protein
MLTDERLLEVAYMKLMLTVIEEPSFLNNLGKEILTHIEICFWTKSICTADG